MMHELHKLQKKVNTRYSVLKFSDLEIFNSKQFELES